jgi:hypothetical protein
VKGGYMAICCQCGKQAIVSISGNPLCVDCNLKLEQANKMRNDYYAQEINYLTEQMEAVTGIYGALPRYRISQPIVQQGALTFHNIKVNNSVVGAINTGNIKNIDIAMSNIKTGGNEVLANEITKFTQAIIDDKKADEGLKNEILEHISFISTQCTLPKEKQKTSIVKVVLSAIEKSASRIAGWLTIWTTLQPLIITAMGIK